MVVLENLMIEIIIVLLSMFLGFVAGRLSVSTPPTTKTDAVIRGKVFELVIQRDYKPMECRKICEALGLYTPREHKVVFSELNRLINEETLFVLEEPGTRRLYCNRVRTLA